MRCAFCVLELVCVCVGAGGCVCACEEREDEGKTELSYFFIAFFPFRDPLTAI